MLKDKDIREPLFDFLEETYGKVRILEEKRMGRSRADIVMVMEDGICGIEIKSDADTYARLQSQVKDYDLYCDLNYVVVGASHGLHIREHVPEWWGVITVEEIEGQQGLDFYMLRKASLNPRLSLKRKISILWRPELAHIQDINMLPKYRDKSKAFVIGKIIEMVPVEMLNQQISQELFERDYNQIEETIREYRKARRRRK